MKIPKKRIYLRFPMSWRKRIQPLAKVVDEVQQQIEWYVGWKKNYKAYFAFKLSPIYTITDIILICKMLRLVCPDLKKISHSRSETSFGSMNFKGLVVGKTPKLRRVRLRDSITKGKT